MQHSIERLGLEGLGGGESWGCGKGSGPVLIAELID